MLARHILGYLPSLVIPAFVAFGAIFCYTRLLSPEQFGYYALTLNTMTLIAAICYYWLQTSLSRLIPQAMREGREASLRTTAYTSFGIVSFCLILVTIIYANTSLSGEWRNVILIAVPLAIFRALLNINQAIHRSQLRIGRYNVIECGQAVIGLFIGLVLVIAFHMGSYGAVLGMMIGMGVMGLIDIGSITKLSFRDYSKPAMREILYLGLPMIATCGISTFLAVSDRFLVEHYKGAAMLGIYAAGYTVMDRIITILFMMIATPSFPLTIHKLEHEGVGAAQAQTYNNGIAMLLIAVPACAGLIITSPQIAALLIGPEFREGALLVMPYIAVSAILNGFATHYFDYAFYFAKKPHRLIYTQGPAALLNLALNLIFIPRYGILGAAYANVAAYIVQLVLSISLGRKLFKVSFPVIPCIQIMIITILMSVVLLAIPFPISFIGFFFMLLIGTCIYSALVVLLDVGAIRSKLVKLIPK